MPYLIFRDFPILYHKGEQPQKPDLSLPNIHPPIPDARNSRRVVSVQEGKQVRVALYNEDFRGRPDIRMLHNPTGMDLTGLPAGNPRGATGEDSESIRFGDKILLRPYLEPSKWIGSKEWPNHLWWRRVHGNYYIIRLYRGQDYWTTMWEHLYTEEKGQDCSIYLGESFEQPGKAQFHAVFAGHIALYPEERKPTLELIRVEEKDLPADFPKDLVRWIP
jgi:hypothetical protein